MAEKKEEKQLEEKSRFIVDADDLIITRPKKPKQADKKKKPKE